MAFLKHIDGRHRGYYMGSLLLFVTALFSKPTAVVLPIALVFAPLLLAGKSNSLGRSEIQPFSAPQLLRLIPFFAVSLAFGLLTIHSEGVSEGEDMPDLPWSERPFIAATTIWFYFSKALIPIDLAPLYPQWNVDTSSLLYWLSLTSLLALSGLLFVFRKQIEGPILWSLLNFVIPLLPVCGLFKFGYLRLSNVADHFMYLSVVGFAVLLAVCVDLVREKLKTAAAYVLSAGACAYLLFLIVQTVLLTQIWQDSVTFWTYNLKANPNSWTAHNFLGHALMKAGRPAEAISHFQQTVRLKDNFIAHQERLSDDLELIGQSSKAKAELRKAAPIKAGMYVAHHNLGNALLLSKMVELAEQQFRIALKLKPTYVNARVNLGLACLIMQNTSESVQHLERAVQENPNNFEAQYNLGLAYDASGESAKAEEHFRKAKMIRPDYSPSRIH
jgi:tetratricopeptide (TPR) repeat protein